MKRLTAVLLAVVLVLMFSASAAETRQVYESRLRASSFVFQGRSYAGKKDAMIAIAGYLLDAGFEPAFVAGVMANVACEGTFGMFENITGYTQTRLTQVFPNLRPCSESGKAHQNYIAHMKGFTQYDRCGHDHSEYAAYYKKRIYDSGISLSAVGDMLEEYASEGWKAKFGLGSMQWTGGRTATLFGFYRAAAGEADTITQAQCASAEMEMIVYELSHSYKYVYTGWQSANGRQETSDAAYEAGYKVCYSYEVPASRATVSVTRGNIARDIYAVMEPWSVADEPPEAVTGLTRGAAAVSTGGTVTLAWDASANAKGYRLAVYRNGARQLGMDLGSTRSFTRAAGEPGVYTAEVTAYNDAGDASVASVMWVVSDDMFVLPRGTLRAEAEAFSGTAVRVVVLPDTLAYIAADAFNGCAELMCVVAPKGVNVTVPDGVIVLDE